MMEEILPYLLLGGAVGCLLGYLVRDYDTSLDRNIKDKVNELPKFFEHAGGAIKIVTDFDERFFDEDNVKEGFKRALERGTEIKFLCERDPPEWYKEQVGFEIKQVEKLPFHLMVIGNGCVRLERPHEPLKFGEKKNDIGFIYKDFPKLAEIYSTEFDNLWMKSS